MIAEPCHSDRLRELAADSSRRLLRQAADWLGIRMPEPEICFDLRGRTAGQVRFGRGRPCMIRYNLVLLRENTDAFLAETVPHEVAHLIAFARYGSRIRPHGSEWRAVMEYLGAEPYHCGCRNHRLSSIRHNRVLAGYTYLCRRCSGPLCPGRHSDPAARPDREPAAD
ncbi:MAG: hypothetical protein H6R22_328 [Chromatiaceae bacterium]|nr:hypothetical protein [Chromatiaceae bacterium]